METGGVRELWASSGHYTCLLGVWVYFICLPLLPSRIADFQDVLKEPTIALEKLRELSFSGKRQLSVFRVFQSSAVARMEGKVPRPHLLSSGGRPASWGLLQILWS